jgi:hypothetical protein
MPKKPQPRKKAVKKPAAPRVVQLALPNPKTSGMLTVLSEGVYPAPPTGVYERVISFKVEKSTLVLITTIGTDGSHQGQGVVVGPDGQQSTIGFAGSAPDTMFHGKEHDCEDEEYEE